MSHPARALYVFLQMTQNTFLAVVILNAQTRAVPALRDRRSARGADPARGPADRRGVHVGRRRPDLPRRELGDPRRLVTRRDAGDRAHRPAGGARAGRDPRPRGASRRAARPRARRPPNRRTRALSRGAASPDSGDTRRVDVPAADYGDDVALEVGEPASSAVECQRGDAPARPTARRRAAPARRRAGRRRRSRLRSPSRSRRDGRAGGRTSVRPSACVRVPSAIVRDTSRGSPPDDLAALERLPRVRGQLGLDADHPDVGSERLHRGRDAAGQPTATDRHEDERDIRQVLDDLETDRALTGDDPVVVERRDDRQSPLRGDRLGACLSLVARPGRRRRSRRRRRATRSRLIAGASSGITTTAGMPSRRAARATPWAWLPDEYVMTRALAPPRASEAIAL